MVSDYGGQTWLVVRQHYLTDDHNRFLDTLLQGKRFKMIGDLSERANQTEPRKFLEALYSRYFRDHTGYIEIRVIGKDDGIADSIFLQPGDLSDELPAGKNSSSPACRMDDWNRPNADSQSAKADDAEGLRSPLLDMIFLNY